MDDDPKRVRGNPAFAEALALVERSLAGVRFDRALFLHVPSDPDPSEALRHYHRDCVRHALSEARARTGEKDMWLIVLRAARKKLEGSDELFAERPELAEMMRDPTLHASLVDAGAEEESFYRLAVMSVCELGGVVGASLDPRGNREGWLGGSLCVGEHKLVYVTDAHDRALRGGYFGGLPRRVWHGAGDTLVHPRLDVPPSDLAAARANLVGCPPTFWINLDRCVGRREHMERQFDAYRITRARRVSAIDGSDVAEIDARVAMPPLNPDAAPDVVAAVRGLAACTASHVTALAEFLDMAPEDRTSGAPEDGAPEDWALVLEDDTTFELAHLWRRTLAEYLASVPATRSIVQLGVIFAGGGLDPVKATELADPLAPVVRRPEWFSTVAYAIRRDRARRIVSAYLDRRTGVVDLSGTAPGNSFHPEPFLYEDDALSIPLVNFLGTDSAIDPYNPVNQGVAKGFVRKFWDVSAASSNK